MYQKSVYISTTFHEPRKLEQINHTPFSKKDNHYANGNSVPSSINPSSWQFNIISPFTTRKKDHNAGISNADADTITLVNLTQ